MDVLTGKQIVDINWIERDAQWATWSSKIGFPVMGIWKRGISDLTQVKKEKVRERDRERVGRRWKDRCWMYGWWIHGWMERCMDV